MIWSVSRKKANPYPYPLPFCPRIPQMNFTPKPPWITVNYAFLAFMTWSMSFFLPGIFFPLPSYATLATYWKPLVSKAQQPWEVLSDYPKNTEAPTEAIYSVEKTEPVSWCLGIHEQRNRRTVRLITTHFCFPRSHAILPEKARLILAPAFTGE